MTHCVRAGLGRKHQVFKKVSVQWHKNKHRHEFSSHEQFLDASMIFSQLFQDSRFMLTQRLISALPGLWISGTGRSTFLVRNTGEKYNLPTVSTACMYMCKFTASIYIAPAPAKTHRFPMYNRDDCFEYVQQAVNSSVKKLSNENMNRSNCKLLTGRPILWVYTKSCHSTISLRNWQDHWADQKEQ